jgi:CDP-glucose 4,6-dehydratase
MENLGLMEYLKNHYQGKKVFVTGHTGFKGSWLVQILSILGASIKGYALAPDQKINLFDEMSGADLCESVIHDIRDKEALKKAILDFQPDYVFHLAAQPLVRLSYEIPVDTFEVNVIGTANVLDCLRFLEKKCSVVLITTDKVYHNQETEYAYKENDRLGG